MWLYYMNIYSEYSRWAGSWDAWHTILHTMPLLLLMSMLYVYEFDGKEYYNYSWYGNVHVFVNCVFYMIIGLAIYGWICIFMVTLPFPKLRSWRSTDMWWSSISYYWQRLWWYGRVKHFSELNMYSQTNQTTWMNCRLADKTPDNKYVNDPINSMAQWSQDVANWFICMVFGLMHEVVWLLCTDSFVFIEFYTFTEWMSFMAVLIEGTRWYTWMAHFFAIMFFWTVAHRFFAFLQYRSHHMGPELGAVFSPMYLPYTYSSVVTKNSLYLSYVHLLGMNMKENVKFIEKFPFKLEKAWEMGYDLPLFWTGWIHFVNDSPAYVYGDHYSGGVSRHVEKWAKYKVSNMILAGGPFSFNCFGPFSYLVIHDDGDDEYPWKLGERKWYHATMPPMPEMDW